MGSNLRLVKHQMKELRLGGLVRIPALPPTSSVTPEQLLTYRLASLVSAVNWGSLPRSVLVKVEVRIAKS